jgi:hypothetical protein
MSSQNNSGRQFDKTHAVTLVAQSAIAAHTFVGYDGNPATSAAGVHDSQGIAEFDAIAGDALTVVTRYSYLVVAGAAIAFGDYLKPAADGSGKAIVGAAGEHCARALGTAVAGQLVEAQLVQHLHAAAA